MRRRRRWTSIEIAEPCSSEEGQQQWRWPWTKKRRRQQLWPSTRGRSPAAGAAGRASGERREKEEKKKARARKSESEEAIRRRLDLEKSTGNFSLFLLFFCTRQVSPPPRALDPVAFFRLLPAEHKAHASSSRLVLPGVASASRLGQEMGGRKSFLLCLIRAKSSSSRPLLLSPLLPCSGVLALKLALKREPGRVCKRSARA